METPRRQNSIKWKWVTGISIALVGCLGLASITLPETGLPPRQESKVFPSYSGFEGIDLIKNHFLVKESYEEHWLK